MSRRRPSFLFCPLHGEPLEGCSKCCKEEVYLLGIILGFVALGILIVLVLSRSFQGVSP